MTLHRSMDCNVIVTGDISPAMSKNKNKPPLKIITAMTKATSDTNFHHPGRSRLFLPLSRVSFSAVSVFVLRVSNLFSGAVTRQDPVFFNTLFSTCTMGFPLSAIDSCSTTGMDIRIASLSSIFGNIKLSCERFCPGRFAG